MIFKTERFVGCACLVLTLMPGLLPGAGHPVPADKQLSPDWIAELTARGKPERWSGKDLRTIGMPVGGIGTGQLYLRGDGTLGLWQIFNRRVFTGTGKDCYRTYRPESPVEQGFAVMVESSGQNRTLRLNEQGFRNIEFVGEYPIGAVEYSDPGAPVRVRAEVFSPFIPLNAPDSALPATIFSVTVENCSRSTLSVRLSGWLENAAGCNSAPSIVARRRTRMLSGQNYSAILHTLEELPEPQPDQSLRPTIMLADFEEDDYGRWEASGRAFGSGPARGTLPGQQKVSGFLGEGLVNTFLSKDGTTGRLVSPPFEIERKYIRFLVGGGNHAGATCVNLLVGGKAVRTAAGSNNERLTWQWWQVGDLEGQHARIEILDRATGAWGHINIDQIELADEIVSLKHPPVDHLPDYGSLALSFRRTSAVKPSQDVAVSLDGLLAKVFDGSDSIAYGLEPSAVATARTEPVSLMPGQSLTCHACLAWFFPNHLHGHEYTNRFQSAGDVVDYVWQNEKRLTRDTRLWHRTFYEDSSLPRWLLFRLHSTVSNLATGTCQWWKSGRFWAWEGVGCCAGTCTHVWNYEHALAWLFPSLERSVREMQDFGEGFQEDTGLVGFRSNRAYAADGQCGTILKAFREHRLSPDDSFLRKHWPSVRRALSYCTQRDGDGDGVIEDSQHNTFDISFYGPNTFVGSLYLGALRAGEEMARHVGDDDFAARCRDLFESGSASTAENLWNGEYFIQDVDLAEHPRHQYGDGCLSDQLFGQGWAHILGLGYLYPVDRVREALASVWRYNWAPDVGPYNALHPPGRVFARPGEAGLFTCTWPGTQYLAKGVRYKNEVWTGIEYQVAGHMMREGMVTEALSICRGIHERYHPSRHNPYNEVECGDHYARALASWGVYLAVCGYQYSGPDGSLEFAPRLNGDFRAAFTAAQGWGLFAQKRRGDALESRIELRYGTLKLSTLTLKFPVATKQTTASAAVNGENVPVRQSRERDGRVELEMQPPLNLSPGDELTVTLK